jgi:3-phenylpropionate/trans-cinnamate dioxygenase ferredoxin reductase component
VKDVVVIGTGLAGVRCAETLRAEGFDGRIVVVGEERHAPYERPALSKDLLAGTRDDIALRTPFHWHELGIELVLGARVDRVRDGVASAGQRSWRFDRLVLATGARPRRLPDARCPRLHHLRTLDDARALREQLRPGRKLVVVGSGFVGAEVASTAARMGIDVTVVEAASAPLGGLLGEDAGAVLEHAYRRHGIELRLGASVKRIDARSTVLVDGTRLAHDLVLVGIGVEPVRELHAERALLAGDMTGSGHWSAAAEQGAAAARRLLGLPGAPPQPSFVWSDQLGFRLQIVGQPQQATRVELEGDETAFVARYFDVAGTMLGAVAANRPAATADLRRELAAVASAA